MRFKWKLAGTYLVLLALALFLAAVGVEVQTKGSIGRELSGIMVTAFLLTVPISYYWAHNYGKRIDDLNFGTKSLLAGKDLPRRFYDTRDELGELGENIFLVARKLQNHIHDISRESSKTTAILRSMLEGVAAIDHIGRVLVFNLSAQKMFEKSEDEVTGRYMTDLVRDAQFEEHVHRVLDRGESVRYEFLFNGKTLRVLMSPFVWDQGTQGAVLVCQDMTEIRKLEQIRTEFVANVSHELRTPLTSIKGFAETLIDGAAEEPEIRSRFLQIIFDETSRLQRLIEDLLLLANVENRRDVVNRDPAAVDCAYARVAEVLSPLAAAKNILLTINIKPGLPKVNIGEELLSQLFLNLIENAIKYTPAGGKVWLNVSCLAGQVEISVADTGQGIPAESLPRIFERFYRVDKARSREMGGTGLGLSIVKHIVEQAHGQLSVESELGKGTIFTIRLPFEQPQEH